VCSIVSPLDGRVPTKLRFKLVSLAAIGGNIKKLDQLVYFIWPLSIGSTFKLWGVFTCPCNKGVCNVARLGHTALSIGLRAGMNSESFVGVEPAGHMKTPIKNQK